MKHLLLVKRFVWCFQKVTSNLWNSLIQIVEQLRPKCVSSTKWLQCKSLVVSNKKNIHWGIKRESNSWLNSNSSRWSRNTLQGAQIGNNSGKIEEAGNQQEFGEENSVWPQCCHRGFGYIRLWGCQKSSNLLCWKVAKKKTSSAVLAGIEPIFSSPMFQIRRAKKLFFFSRVKKDDV